MKISSKKEKSIERQIAIGMIVSDSFLRQISPLYNSQYLISPFAKKTTMWCFDYFGKYDKAPKEEIQDIYEKYVEKGNIDEDESDLIEAFLDSISGEYARSDKFNSDYILDQTVKYFKRRSLEIMANNVYASLRDGNEEEAEDIVTQFVHIDRIENQGIDPLADEESIKRAFEESREPLFKYPGDLGKLINADLCRGSFFAIIAPTKRGKTWWIWDMVMRASLSRCNAAFFQAGDMTEEQQLRRIYISLSRRPLKEQPQGVLIPVFDCLYNQTGSCTMRERSNDTLGVLSSDRLEELFEFDEADSSYKPCTYCMKKYPKRYKPSIWYEKRFPKALTAEEAIAIGKKFKQRMGKRRVKLSTHPNKTLSVDKIRRILDAWEVYEGFVPDVIAIDYADIMIPNRKFTDFRHSQNDIWQDLRALSQERNCLVITATQADAASYEAKSVRQKNFSEDRRKLDHVTSMIALNQTAAEKRKGLMRIGLLLARDAEFDIDREVYVMQNLTIGRPHLGSFFQYTLQEKENSNEQE